MIFSKTHFIFLLVVLFTFSSESRSQTNIKWHLLLHQPGKEPYIVGNFIDKFERPVRLYKKSNGINVTATFEKVNDQIQFTAIASSSQKDSCYISLQATYIEGETYTYLGEQKEDEIYRQSPHNPEDGSFAELMRQDVPMFAIKDSTGFTVAINNSPVFYDNYTVQHIKPSIKQVTISSGDDGKGINPLPKHLNIKPYHHLVEKGKPHTFSGIIFKSKANNINDLRKDVMLGVAKRWSGIEDRLGATSWASNYMLLRKNETKYSDVWVVAGNIYAHKQFTRDGFWQSFVLPAEFAAECYRHEAVSQAQGAERPLFTLIWAYRTKLNGGEVNMAAARRSLKYIDDHIKDNKFYSNNNPVKKDFQYWLDVVAFDIDDVITANQGLAAVALLSAEKLGLKPKSSADLVIKQYQNMFNKEKGYFPISEKKDLLSVDVLMGDLLAQVLFDRPLLSSDMVNSTFQSITRRSKTPYGYKIVSMPNGDYALPELYNATDFKVDPGLGKGVGSYQAGGSWYLYDMLFLLDCYLHKVPGAKEELLWRGALDFKLGGTFFEHTNTVTGIPDKPNQGWNAAVYSIWKILMDKGLADQSLLDAIK
ncbi:MAG: hypothetical protein QM594_04980 [Niabella sp.]